MLNQVEPQNLKRDTKLARVKKIFYHEAVFDFLIRCLSWRVGRETSTEQN